MAVVNYLKVKHQSRTSMRGVIGYVCQDCKVDLEPGLFGVDHTQVYNRNLNHPDSVNCIKLITGVNCCAETAYKEFMATKKRFRKDTGMFFYHYTQSFRDGENISPQKAHEIALKFAEDNFKGFEVLVATHVDNEHLHSHFIINSVSFETGMKLHSGPDTLQKLRAYSDQVCAEQGLSILQPYQKSKTQTISQREYRSAVKGESWKFALIRAIEDALLLSDTRGHFIANMEYEGYTVNWSPSRKYITYTTPEGKRCRDISLHDDTYLKDNLEKLFDWRMAHRFVPGTPEPPQGWLSLIAPPPRKKKQDQDEDSDMEERSAQKPAAPVHHAPPEQPDNSGHDVWEDKATDIRIRESASAAVPESDQESVVPPAPEGVAGILDEALRLGKGLEDTANVPPPAAPVSHAESRIRQRELIKKLAQGYKLPSEQEQEESQSWSQQI